MSSFGSQCEASAQALGQIVALLVTLSTVTCCAVQVCEALLADPVDLAGMSGALRWISTGLTKELAKIREEAAHSFPIAVKAAKAKPFYNSSQQHLKQLSAAIGHRGPPILTTYTRDDAQVGFATNPTDNKGPPIPTTYSRDGPQVGFCHP